MEIPLEIQEAAKIDGCSWFGGSARGDPAVPARHRGAPGGLILGFMFCWECLH